MSVRSRLVTQLIRSLREHPEDWEFSERWARNEHIKIRVWKKNGPPFLDVWYGDDCVVPEWPNPLSYFVPWRCRFLHALREAERDHLAKKASLRVEDTFETPTLDAHVLNHLIGVVANFQDQVQARRR